MNRFVVIAEGDPQRARSMAEACAGARIAHKVVAHGAAALELALAEQPVLVIAALDLPLVDGLKLAEILRANPRTQTARFLFIGDNERISARATPGDRILSASAGPEEIVAAVEELIETQARIESFETETQAGGEAEGDLTELSLTELLGLLHLNRKSGSLRLRWNREDAADQDGWILIRKGEVIQAQIGSVEGEKALMRMLARRQGRFSFDPEELDELPKILTPTHTLLSEGVRQLEEWDRLAAQLPPLDAQVKLRVKTGELPNIVHPLTQEVLLLLELYSQVREVVDQCSFPDYQVLRTLHTLAVRGIVELGRARAPRASTAACGLFDAAQSRRLRAWLQDSGRRGAISASGKLLISGANPSDASEFIRLLGQVPGVSLSAAAQQDKIAATDLVTIGSVDVDEGCAFDLLHLPADPQCAPLWPLAGYGALGTLFLISGAVAEAATRLQAIADSLRDLPRARIFHVVLLHKDQRISPEELRENLALIDEASLFLLPLESGKDPAALLRSLFARLVP